LLQPERAENGYRTYGPDDVLRIQHIRQLQSLGLRLKEIARLLARDDDWLWEDVLHALRQEVSDELVLLRRRLERIERLLEEGLPPDQEHLPDPPDEVNRYLEQNLPQASLVAWHNDSRIYNSIHALIQAPPQRPGDDRFAAGHEEKHPSPWHVGQPWMVPSTLDVSPGMGRQPGMDPDAFPLPDGRGEGMSFTAGEREILQLLRSLGHLQEIEEDVDR
jgi:DNA-binding transcriptional MerR regulator